MHVKFNCKIASYLVLGPSRKLYPGHLPPLAAVERAGVVGRRGGMFAQV